MFDKKIIMEQNKTSDEGQNKNIKICNLLTWHFFVPSTTKQKVKIIRLVFLSLSHISVFFFVIVAAYLKNPLWYRVNFRTLIRLIVISWVSPVRR